MSIFEPMVISGSVNGGAYGKRIEEISTKNGFTYATNQQAEFSFSAGEGSFWSPSESWVQISYVIGNATGAINSTDSAVNLAFDSCAGCWGSGKFFINNRVVSDCNEIPAVDAYLKRVNHSESYRNTVGQNQLLESTGALRNTTSKQSKTRDFVWKPHCLSIFQNPNLIPPNSEMRMTLQKHADSLDNLIFCGLPSTDTAAGTAKVRDTDYSLSISDVKLYCTFYDGPTVQGGSEWAYELDEVEPIKTAIGSSTTLNKQFNVPQNLYKLGFGFQGSSVGTDGQQPQTHFDAYTQASSARAKNQLRTFSCTLGNQRYPFSSDYSVNYTQSDPGTNSWSRPYYDYLLASNQDMNSAGAESLTTYMNQLGPILCFPVVNQGSSANSTLNVKATFASAPTAQDVVILAQHKQYLRIKYNSIGQPEDTWISSE
tara:strand:+ start:954 stop:2237 length:1284 start_codon:yes stop_codon:yes gene_type:complete